MIYSIASIGASPTPQTSIDLKNVQVFYTVGENATFQAEYETTSIVTETFLHISPQGRESQVFLIENARDGQILFPLDLTTLGIYPFSRIYYWFEWSLIDGTKFSSAAFWFDYLDNRFEWQSQISDVIEIYWQVGDGTFAQSIFNTARTSIEDISEIINAQLPQPLKIVVYSNPTDLQSALNFSDQTWIAGHANPALGMVFISLPEGPNQQLELERQLPHEIMHLAEYQLAGPSYADQPVWLKEGLASIVELYPNSDYERVLQKAAANHTIVPLKDYCLSFPKDASGAFQAYAQSSSFVKFLREQFGSASLQLLILNYRGGMNCQEGFYNTYGINLQQAQNQWQKSILGINTNQVAWNNLSPYLALSAFLVISPVFSIFVHRRKGKLF